MPTARRASSRSTTTRSVDLFPICSLRVCGGAPFCVAPNRAPRVIQPSGVPKGSPPVLPRYTCNHPPLRMACLILTVCVHFSPPPFPAPLPLPSTHSRGKTKHTSSVRASLSFPSAPNRHATSSSFPGMAERDGRRGLSGDVYSGAVVVCAGQLLARNGGACVPVLYAHSTV